MTLDQAVHVTQIILGFAFVVQSIEHLASFHYEQLLYVPRLILAVFLMFGFYPEVVCYLLLLLGLLTLDYFQGPYNGGSDRMGLLVLFCLCLEKLAPNDYWRQMAMAYLAAQLTLSYFISGWVKVVNPQWRNGMALQDVFRFTAYPVSESLRAWAAHPRLLWFMGWCVMVLELVFPFTLVSQLTLAPALLLTGSFHLANACLFGLNRFFWVWVSAYPAIWWFQGRVFS